VGDFTTAAGGAAGVGPTAGVAAGGAAGVSICFGAGAGTGVGATDGSTTATDFGVAAGAGVDHEYTPSWPARWASLLALSTRTVPRMPLIKPAAAVMPHWPPTMPLK